MDGYKTYTLLTLTLLIFICTISLLTGFVPQKEGSQVRRQVSNHTIKLQIDDMPKPIIALSSNRWSIRQNVNTNNIKKYDGKDSTNAVTGNIVSFEEDGITLGNNTEIFLFTNNGKNELAPLLALDGASTPTLLTNQPNHYGDTLDTKGHPIRWQEQENILIGYLPVNLQNRKYFNIINTHIKLESLSDPNAYQKYKNLIENFAAKYDLNVALVYAIIQSESNFSTTLISNKSAMGLMQLLPSTASGEIHKFLYGHSGNIGFDDLCIPEINIRYGTTYLHILMTKYFQDVKDPLSKEYCTIAAYNMGPNRLLRYYGKNDSEAIEKINSMTPQELYTELTAHLPIRETRFYVAKVQRIKGLYTNIN